MARVFIDVDGGFGHKIAPRLEALYGQRRPRVYVSNSAHLLDLCANGDLYQTRVLVPVHPEAADAWILDNMEPGDALLTRDLKLIDAFIGLKGHAFNMCRRYALRRAIAWLKKTFP